MEQLRESRAGFLEKFALSTNRDDLLKKLRPESDAYYYFHCLHYQNTNQLKKARKLLNEWKKKKKDYSETEDQESFDPELETIETSTLDNFFDELKEMVDDDETTSYDPFEAAMNALDASKISSSNEPTDPFEAALEASREDAKAFIPKDFEFLEDDNAFDSATKLEEIKNRQALLEYSTDPERTKGYLIQKLKLRFQEQKAIKEKKPEANQKSKSGTVTIKTKTADLQQFSYEVLRNQFLKQKKNLSPFDPNYIHLLHDELFIQKKKWLDQYLRRLKHPGLPKLADLVVTHMQTEEINFGSLLIHDLLTLNQLDRCSTLMPELLQNNQFLSRYFSKLLPEEDLSLEKNREIKKEFLSRAWQFAQKLPITGNPIKAYVLYHLLDLHQSQGDYDFQLFMEYLRIPKYSITYNPSRLDNQAPEKPVRVDTGFFRKGSEILKISNHTDALDSDESLLSKYLEHFLIHDKTIQKEYIQNRKTPFDDYLRKRFIRLVFDETCLLYDLKDENISSEKEKIPSFSKLAKRSELRFLPNNQTCFQVNDPVTIQLELKNISQLIIQVFKIDGLGYYQNTGKEIDLDIDVAGYKPHFETIRTYDHPPILRVKEQFDFPELNEKGIYLIDFIGNNINSRALIRIGQIKITEELSPLGHVFRFYDEKNNALTDCELYLLNKTGSSTKTPFLPDDTGSITVPFLEWKSVKASIKKSIIIKNGQLVTMERFAHKKEQYHFKTNPLLSMESLIPGNEAALLFHSTLHLDEKQVSLSLLERVTLQLKLIDSQSRSTVVVYDNLVLKDAEECLVKFNVPQDLRKIEWNVTAQLKGQTTDEILFNNGSFFRVNGINATPKIYSFHLTKEQQGYVLRCMGKNGEPTAGKLIVLTLNSRYFNEEIIRKQRTDEQGEIHLGNLEGITLLLANSNSEKEQGWIIDSELKNYSRELTFQTGKQIKIPLYSKIIKIDHKRISLLSLKKGLYCEDYFDHLSIENNELIIRDLPTGTYELNFREFNHTITINVYPGIERDRHLLTDYQAIRLKESSPLQFKEVVQTKERITIQLLSFSPFTRVHIIADRFANPSGRWYDWGKTTEMSGNTRTFSALNGWSQYYSDRKTGTEFSYITQRKYLKKHPGNMLPRAELLLKPLELRDAIDEKQTIDYPELFEVNPSSGGSYSGSGETSHPEIEKSSYPCYDFLKEQSLLLHNLKPDKNGIIEVDKTLFDSWCQLHIFAMEPSGAIYKQVSLEKKEIGFVDRRLNEILPSQKNHTESKQAFILQKNQPGTIPVADMSKFVLINTIRAAFDRLTEDLNDKAWNEFQFLKHWNQIDREEKLKLYSKYICHELNLFLYQKDREFFDRIIQPFLKNKKNKSFMDRWLLDEPLDAYKKRWKNSFPCLFEMALLCLRHPELKEGFIDYLKREIEQNQNEESWFDRAFGADSQSDAIQKEHATGKKQHEKHEEQELDFSDLDGMDDINWSEVDAELQQNRQMLKEELKQERKRNVYDQPGSRSRNGGQVLSQEDVSALLKGISGSEVDEDFDLPDMDSDDEALSSYDSKKGGCCVVNFDEPALTKALAEESDDDDSHPLPTLYYDKSYVEGKRKHRLYQPLGPAKEWVEQGYYQQLPTEGSKNQKPSNHFARFLLDFISHSHGTPFLSPWFAENSGSFKEKMFVLSLLDLPFNSKPAKQKRKGASLQIKTKEISLLLIKSIVESTPKKVETQLSIKQVYYRYDSQVECVKGKSSHKFIHDQFLPGVVYGARMIVSNQSFERKDCKLFYQIPQGAIPVHKTSYLGSRLMELQPLTIKTFDYFFYFPSPGSFSHYPAQLALEETVVSQRETFQFEVKERVETEEKIDKDQTPNWKELVRFGSDETILEYLNSENSSLASIDLEALQPRLGNRAFYEKLIQLLRKKMIFDRSVFCYSILHDDPENMEIFLKREKFAEQCGSRLNSPLLDIDPILDHRYEHHDFHPFINARFHPVSNIYSLPNEDFFRQYKRFLSYLTYQENQDDENCLEICWFLLLQDRIEEAEIYFQRIDRGSISEQLQYDYLEIYLLFFRKETLQARQLAESYRDYPVPHWRNRFREVLNQLDEAEGKLPVEDKTLDSLQQQSQQMLLEPIFDFKVEANHLVLTYHNITDCRINFYIVDPELFFSKNPFAEITNISKPHVDPNYSLQVELPQRRTKHKIEIPSEILSGQAIVEVESHGLRQSRIFTPNRMDVLLFESYGQLKVLEADTGKPLPEVYIKVYSLNKNGDGNFHKDGYTDLRGRFDYVTTNRKLTDETLYFSLLILDEQHGAVTKKAHGPL